jgi:hypothetical protein
MNDNCVSYRTLKLQIPESPLRQGVKVRVYPDGSHARFHGPRCLGRHDQNGARRRNPVDRRTKAEEADICCATKTGQLNSLST